MGLAVELVQLFEHDAAGRHIHAQGECFGGEDGLDQPVDEQLLHNLLEGRQHAGVVRGEPAEQAVPPAPEAEHIEVIRGDVLGGLVDAPGDDLLFGLAGQPESGRDALGHGGIAAGAREDECDGRQEVLPVQAGDDLRPAGLPHRAALGALRFVPLAALLAALVPAAVAEAAAEIHLALGPGHGQQFRVDLEAGPPWHFRGDGGRRAADNSIGYGGCLPGSCLTGSCPNRQGDLVKARVAGKQVHDLPPHHDVLPQRHRAVLGDDHIGLPADGVEPRTELLGVGDRGTQGRHLDLAGQMDDDFLPHSAAEAVGEVVDFVHDHEAEIIQGVRIRVEHVAEHFGGHDHHRGVAVDAGISGEQAHLGGAVLGGQFGVLLVAQGFDGGGVERLEPTLEGQIDGELPHNRLPGAGGGGHQHAPAGLQGQACFALEVIEFKFERADEPAQIGLGFSSPLDAGAVTFGR